MSEAFFALLLALAWFGAVNAALSTASAAVGWLIARGAIGLRDSSEPAVLLLLKLAPGAVAIFFACVLFLPAHWRFEPEGVEESAGYTLVALAALGALTLALAARRAVRDAAITRRVEGGWRARAGRPLALAGGRLPVYGLPDEAPVISLAGLIRPRVFVARSIRDVLTSDELEVSLAHELAHHDSRDNLKRMLVACSPDLLGLWRSGRALERRWRAAVEFSADARAVAGREGRALSLASALLKVARLAPAAGSAAASGLFDGTLLSARIDRLLAPKPADDRPRPIAPRWRLVLGGATLLAAALAVEAAWFGVHLATEGLIRLLP